MEYALNILYSNKSVCARFLKTLHNHLKTINVEVTNEPTNVVLCLIDAHLLNNFPNLEGKTLLPMFVGACDISNTILKGKAPLNKGKICKTEDDIYEACQEIKSFFNNLKPNKNQMQNLIPTNINVIVSGTKRYQTFETNRKDTVAIFVQTEEFGVDVKSYLESIGKLPTDGTRIGLAVYHGGKGVIELQNNTFKDKPADNDYHSQKGNIVIDMVHSAMTPLTSFITQDGKNPKLMFTTNEKLSVSGQLGGGVDNNSVVVVRVYQENKPNVQTQIREKSTRGFVGGGENSGINYGTTHALVNPTLISELTIVLLNGTRMDDDERFVQKGIDVSSFFSVFDNINRVK